MRVSPPACVFAGASAWLSGFPAWNAGAEQEVLHSDTGHILSPLAGQQDFAASGCGQMAKKVYELAAKLACGLVPAFVRFWTKEQAFLFGVPDRDFWTC